MLARLWPSSLPVLPVRAVLVCSVLVCLLPAGPAPAAIAGQDGAGAGSLDPRQAAREEAFVEMLTNVTLKGFFTASDAPKDRPLQEDRYVIEKVSKVESNLWRFDSRIQYGGRNAVVPLALPVEWAGDTPVITMTEQPVPFFGTFTCRILFHGGQYAGTWSGEGHSGQMFGLIERNEPAPGQGDEDGDGPPREDDREPREESETAWRAPRAVPVEPVLPASRIERGHRLAPERDQSWPSFRGRGACGVQEGHPLPATFCWEVWENVLWDREIPGLCHSSPIVWEDLVFVQTAVREGEEAELKIGLYGSIEPVEDEGMHAFKVYCIDKQDGEIRWERTAIEAVPRIQRHPKGSHAASTPATDGKRVVAFFGSEGLYCYDVEGNLLWKKDLGVLDAGYYLVKEAQWGFSSCPVLHEGKVIVQCDVQDDSFLAAFDADTGEELWRAPRDEVPTWGSPTVVEDGGRTQVVVNGWRHIGGYDLETGKQLWKLAGGGDIPVPTPVFAHGLIYITNAHGRMAPIYAIKPTATGTITAFTGDDPYIAWGSQNLGNYMQTPIVYGEHAYFCSDSGVLRCYDARTGEMAYQQRLGGGRDGFTASAVAGDGKLYFTSEEGVIHVVKAGPEFELLAENEMGQPCMATPAISEGRILFRMRNHLAAVALVDEG